MLSSIIDFANMFLAALMVGAMFGVWLLLNPAGLNASAYVSLQQQAIRTLNAPMPALGAVTIASTIVAAVFARADRTRLTLLGVTLLCFLAAGLITRFLNQPINAIVITWNSDAPPSNWKAFRDEWWRWHLVRTAAGFGGLSLLISSTLQRVRLG